MELSPDGKAYLIGHGGAPSPNIQAWMLGDNIHMARVVRRKRKLQHNPTGI